MKKNIILVISSTIFTFVILYFLIFLKIYFEDFEKERPFLFKSKENLNFHKNYSKKIHHIRNNYFQYGNPGQPENFLFTSINDFEDGKKNILLQGDSWFEQATLQNKSRIKLTSYAKEKNYGLVNAGISSFSPSLMMIQFKILEKDFNIKPNIVIAYIDQTDLGDENCRYKKNRVLDNDGNLISIKSESYTRKLYDLVELYTWSEILLSEDSNVVKKLRLTNFSIKFKYIRLVNKIKDISELGWENRLENRCFFKKITNYLKKSTNEEKNYFQKQLVNYINFLEKRTYIDQIILVTFPHKNHLISETNKNYYSVNVSNIVDRSIKNKEKIKHINFSELHQNNKINIDNKFFEINDPASHLKEEYHTNFFLEKILKNIE